MKAVILPLLLVLPLSARATEIRPGATLAEVNATLGAPRGLVRIGDRQLLYYDRGEIELQTGAVSRVALLTPAEFAAQEARRAAISARTLAELETRRKQRLAEGERLLACKLADPLFRAAPLGDQLVFLESFSQRYPEVSCAEQLLSTRRLLMEQLEASRVNAELVIQAERLAELEARLADSEAWGRRGPFFTYYGGNPRRHFDNRRPDYDRRPRNHGSEHNRYFGNANESFAPPLPQVPLAPIGGNARDTSGIGESPRDFLEEFAAKIRM